MGRTFIGPSIQVYHELSNVVLVDPEHDFSGMEALAPSQISKAIAKQGIFDSALEGLRRQLDELGGDAIGLLRNLSDSTSQAVLQISEPTRTAVTEPEDTLQSLYGGLVKRPSGGSSRITKGRAIDRVVTSLRSRDFHVRRYEYVKDFRFDVVVDNGRPAASVIEVLSFANAKKDWTVEEYHMGHFLHALNRTDLSGIAAIVKPVPQGDRVTFDSYKRVTRWCADEEVPIVDVAEVTDHIAKNGRT